MANQILPQITHPSNGQPTKVDQFTAAFLPNSQQLNIDLTTRRIVAFSRLSIGTSPGKKQFWQEMMLHYHGELKKAMTNPFFRGGER